MVAQDLGPRIQQLFTDVCTSCPEVHQPAQLWGWMETERATVMSSTPIDDKYGSSLRKGEAYGELQGAVYLIGAPIAGILTAVLVNYHDGTLWWLDNHATNTDFEAFIAREGLLNWLPQYPQKLAHLIVGTKLFYLGLPRLLRSSAWEIPVVVEEFKEHYSTEKYRQREQLRDDAVARIADQITSPHVVMRDDGTYELIFWLWTEFAGRVIEITCHFGKDGSFQYSGREIAMAVGGAWMPR